MYWCAVDGSYGCLLAEGSGRAASSRRAGWKLCQMRDGPGSILSIKSGLARDNVIPQNNVRKPQHLFQRAKREKNTTWTKGRVPTVWMETPDAWETVETRAQHNSSDTLKEVAKSNETGGPFSRDPVLRRCGWGVAVLDFTDVFTPSLVFGRGGGSPGAKQTIPRSEVYVGIQAARDPLGYDFRQCVLRVHGPEREGKVLGSKRWSLVPVFTLRRSLFSKSRVTSASGRCGQDINYFGCPSRKLRKSGV